jgi:hypothetical protein
MPRKAKTVNPYLVFVSHSAKDRWIEIGAAWVQEKHVVAIIDQILPSEMPDVIAPYKAIDLNNFDAYVEQQINRAKKAKKRV